MKHSILFISVFSILLSGCGFNCQSYLEENIKPLVISGIVIAKQKANYSCFGTITLKYENQTDTLKDICYCTPEQQGLWKYVQVGDSLYKAPQSILVEVYRKDVIKKFDYPCCSH